jgi:hypothetical protein
MRQVSKWYCRPLGVLSTSCAKLENVVTKNSNTAQASLCLINGPLARVHLVIDCLVNSWLHNQLTREAAMEKSIEAEEAQNHDNVSKQKMIEHSGE